MNHTNPCHVKFLGLYKEFSYNVTVPNWVCKSVWIHRGRVYSLFNSVSVTVGISSRDMNQHLNHRKTFCEMQGAISRIIIYWAHSLFWLAESVHSKFSKSAAVCVASSSSRLYNNHINETWGQWKSCQVSTLCVACRHWRAKAWLKTERFDFCDIQVFVILRSL